MDKPIEILLCTALLLISAIPTNSYAYDFDNLIGNQDEDSKVYAGMFVVHHRSLLYDIEKRGSPGYFVKPNIGIANKGYFINFFKNSFWDPTVSLGISRHWLQSNTASSQMNLGYRLGAIYGYCLNNSVYHGPISLKKLFDVNKCEEGTTRVWRILPTIYFEYGNNNFGIAIDEAFIITTLNFFYRF